MQDPQKHLRTCNLCEAMCGIEITHEQGKILAIRADPHDPLSQGHICPKAVALQDLQEDPDRLRHPMIKTPQGWERISWENAFNEAASRIRNIQAKHGRNAVALYAGNPSIHNVGTMLTLVPLFNVLKTDNRYSATSVDQLAPMLVAMKLYGNQLLLPVPDIDRTDFMLCIGGNPMASNGSLFTAPGFKHRVKALQKRGGKLVVIDPRRTETADIADRHHFIRPGTDALLLMAMLHTLFSQDLVKTGRLSGLVQGVNIVRNMVAGFSPQRVARHVGIKAKDIRQLTVDFASANSACCYGRMGISTHSFGTLTNWLINLLNILTGNLDEPGGVMFTRPAIDLPGLAEVSGQTGSFNSRKSRVRKLPEFGGEFPAATLADEILTEGKGQIKALITIAGNPVLSVPNGKRLETALEKLDFMVAVDFYLNETTRHADIILPPTGPLEHGHYDLALNMVTVRNTAKYSPPLYKPTPDTRHDWEILLELTRRLQPHSPLKWAAGELQYQAMKRMGVEGMLDLLLRIGPYGVLPQRWHPLQERIVKSLYARLDERSATRVLLDASPFSRHTRHRNHQLSLKKLKDNPHGIDLGPLEPCLPDRLATSGKVINLVPNLFIKDIARLQKLLDSPAKQSPDSFLLIGRRDLRSNNSWMHNSQRLVKGKNRCTALMHPHDAERLQIRDGDDIVISSRVGEIEIPAELTEKMMPGVISIPHGWGHHRSGSQLEIARQHAGVSLNDITDERCIDALSGVAAFNGQVVTVSKIKANQNVVRINDKRLALTSNR